MLVSLWYTKCCTFSTDLYVFPNFLVFCEFSYVCSFWCPVMIEISYYGLVYCNMVQITLISYCLRVQSLVTCTGRVFQKNLLPYVQFLNGLAFLALLWQDIRPWDLSRPCSCKSVFGLKICFALRWQGTLQCSDRIPYQCFWYAKAFVTYVTRAQAAFVLPS